MVPTLKANSWKAIPLGQVVCFSSGETNETGFSLGELILL